MEARMPEDQFERTDLEWLARWVAVAALTLGVAIVPIEGAATASDVDAGVASAVSAASGAVREQFARAFVPGSYVAIAYGDEGIGDKGPAPL
jgi:hypothetical protein